MSGALGVWGSGAPGGVAWAHCKAMSGGTRIVIVGNGAEDDPVRSRRILRGVGQLEVLLGCTGLKCVCWTCLLRAWLLVGRELFI